MARATVRARGQITIPKDVREAAGIHDGDVVEVEVTDEGVLLRAAGEPGPEDWQYWSERATTPPGTYGKVYESLEAFIEALEAYSDGLPTNH